MYTFRFEYIFFLYALIPMLCLVVFYRLFYYRPVRYSHSLVSYFAKNITIVSQKRDYILLFLRAFILLVLLLLIAKPQYIDQKSQTAVEGIDIMLALDMSGSMEIPDFDAKNRTRFLVAKEEATHFIEKRIHDAIGLVIFGKYALSRCPLTFDKKLLGSILSALEIGFIDPDGTMINRALVAAINRLKKSASKSKIIILLTDGESSDGDLDSNIAIELAKKFSIKIYTVGIGSDQEEQLFHPLYGPIKKPAVNKTFLTKIAQETGGKMFMAYNADDMRNIYDTIDALEKTNYEIPIFYNTLDLYLLPLWCIIILLFIECLSMTTFFFAL
jgi:Ca-activated chloride channel family protein